MNGKCPMTGEFNIMKSSDDKRLVFGWANVCVDTAGKQVIDWQRDAIDTDVLEEAVYKYVEFSRDGGEMHRRGGVGQVIESIVFTKEKTRAMGIPDGTVPEAWWIGFRISDPDVWDKVKKGKYRMFSIEGKAQRVPVRKKRLPTFGDVMQR